MGDDMPGGFEYTQYRAEPGAVWALARARGADGYSTMSMAQQSGWRPIGVWGRDGWTLGSWPLSVVFCREKDGHFDLALYIEGDAAEYHFPTESLRVQATDQIAFSHWKAAGEPWVEAIETPEQMPEALRGPYSEERSGVEPLAALYQKLGNMLSDVEQNFQDMHPEDVAEILRNCHLTALKLAEEIAARRQYVLELAPYWNVTQSGRDAGMPPVPTVTREGPGVT